MGNRKVLLVLCLAILAVGVPSCGEDAIEDVLTFIDGLPDGTDVLGALRREFDAPPPSFRLLLKNGSDTPPPASIQAATIAIEQVQVVHRRLDDLAEDPIIVGLAGPDQEPITIDLLALDSEQGVEIASEVLPDGEVTEVWLRLASGSLRMDGRDIPLEFAGGPVAGVRLALENPRRIDDKRPGNISLNLDVSGSFVRVPERGFTFDPHVRVAGGHSLGVSEMEPLIGVPTVFPVAVHAASASDLLAYVRVTDATVDRASLRLVRVFPGGTHTVLGPVNDSGLLGDEEADDTFYSAGFTLNEGVGDAFVRVEGVTTDGRSARSLTRRIEIVPPGERLVPVELDESEALAAVQDDITDSRILSRRFLIEMPQGTSLAHVQSLAASVGGTVVGRIPEIHAWQIDISGDGTADAVYEAMFRVFVADPTVEDVAPETVLEGSGVTTNDPQFFQAIAPAGIAVAVPGMTGVIVPNQQWMLEVSVPSAWAFSRGGIRVGVVDSGVNRSHPNISRALLGRDWCFGGLAGIVDNAGHGTLMHGIIGADTNNGTGIAGTTWLGHIVHTKGLCGGSAIGTQGTIGAAIVDAVNRGGWVINLSLGTNRNSANGGVPAASRVSRAARRISTRVRTVLTTTNLRQRLMNFIRRRVAIFSFPLRRAVHYAQLRNRLTVAAAGNSANALPTVPGDYCDLEVAAIDPFYSLGTPVFHGGSAPLTGRLSHFSNHNPCVDIAAPGRQIRSTDRHGTYQFVDGTSPATAIVSGIAALYWSHNRQLSTASVAHAIRDGARDGGTSVVRGSTTHTFRDVDAMETFNRAWTITGTGLGWFNLLNPQGTTVDAVTATYVDRSAWTAAAVPVALPNPSLNGNPGLAAWWFGSPLHGTYIDFARAPGQPPLSGGVSPGIMTSRLRSPPITLLNCTSPTLQYKTWWEIESMDPDTHDLMEVFAVPVSGFPTAIPLATLNPGGAPSNRAPGLGFSSGSTTVAGAPPTWVLERHSLLSGGAPLFGGAPFYIEFRFDTVDGKFNAFMGWLIDEIRIFDAQPPTMGSVTSMLPASPAPSPPLGAPRLRLARRPGGC